MMRSTREFYDDWLDLLSEVYNIQKKELTFDHEGKGSRLKYGYIKSRLFSTKGVSVPFGDYSVLEKHGGGEGELKNVLAEVIKTQNIDRFEIRPPIERTDVFEAADLDKSTDYRKYLLDIEKSKEELLNQMQSGRRRDIKKGRDKQPIRIEFCESEEGLREFYRLYLKTMKRHGTPPHSFAFFRYMWERFYPENMELAKSVHTEKEQAIAANIYFKYDNTVLYSRNGADADYFDLRSNDLLHWRMIQRAKEEDYSNFDFGRTRPGTGVDSYKKRWGAEKNEITYYYYPKAPKKRAEEKRVFEVASNLWSNYVPSAVARGVGPKLRKKIG